MKIAERIVMVSLLIVLVGAGVWIYFSVQANHQEVLESVARGEYEKPIVAEKPVVKSEEWQSIYPDTVPIMIGAVEVKASVADSLPERIKGLSGTPFLPENVVKLFAFGVSDNHSIWMKDMNYPLDIIWVAETGIIVHIEEDVSPDSYPKAFDSPVPAWYVIEANAGFAASNTIAVGNKVSLSIAQ